MIESSELEIMKGVFFLGWFALYNKYNVSALVTRTTLTVKSWETYVIVHNCVVTAKRNQAA